ncbi:MAG: ABC transporter permease [Chloroflexi bacterium]|nr:ABC transporter permease [Chloroflexota bacterium]
MRYILTRLIWLPIVLWAVASLTFLVVHLVPGDPLSQVATLVLDQAQLDRTRVEWGLDQPLWRQYGRFLGNLVRGDLGVSMASGVPLTRLLYEKMPPTIELALMAMLISTIVGIGAGVISSTTRHKWLDYGARTFAILGLSIPWFWIAILFIFVFSVKLKWTPVGGRLGVGVDYDPVTNFVLIDTLMTGNWPALLSFLNHLILPALAIGLTSAGFVARMTRSAMLEVLRADYIRSARAKGLHRRTITFSHALRNAILPVITLQGLQFGTLLGGAVITELVFAWPGLGRMLLDAILRRDYASVQGTVLFVAFFYVVMNLIVDVLYHVVDPRLREA